MGSHSRVYSNPRCHVQNLIELRVQKAPSSGAVLKLSIPLGESRVLCLPSPSVLTLLPVQSIFLSPNQLCLLLIIDIIVLVSVSSFNRERRKERN